MRALPGWLTLAGAAGYVATIAVAGARTPGYRHCCRLISELGETGAPAATAMHVMLVTVGLATLVLAVALQRSLRTPTGAALVGLLGAGLVLGGVFSCDPGCKPVTPAGWTHIISSIPATLAALVAPFVFAARMRRVPAWAPYARTSAWIGVASVAAILAAFFLFPAIGANGTGQRLATFVQLAWMAWLGSALIRVRA